MEEKEKLRDKLRESRLKISDLCREKYSHEICKKLIREINQSEKVLVYCAKNPEVETLWLIDDLLSKNIDIIVPIIEKETINLRLSYILNRNVLKISTFQVPEPIGNEIPAKACDVTTAIIPMLGFDKYGGRIGYGSGYYDRFLSENTHIRKIGIAFSIQEISNVPMQDFDIKMDMIVTENQILRFNNNL